MLRSISGGHAAKLWNVSVHTEAWRKWLISCRRHFTKVLLERRTLCSDSNFTERCSTCPDWQHVSIGSGNGLSPGMMTSSNGNTFRATGPLCGEFTGEFPSQRPVTRSVNVFFGLCLNKRLSKQSYGWWFDTPLRPLWRHCNARLTTSDMPVLVQVMAYHPAIQKPFQEAKMNLFTAAHMRQAPTTTIVGVWRICACVCWL